MTELERSNKKNFQTCPRRSITFFATKDGLTEAQYKGGNLRSFSTTKRFPCRPFFGFFFYPGRIQITGKKISDRVS